MIRRILEELEELYGRPDPKQTLLKWVINIKIEKLFIFINVRSIHIHNYMNYSSS